MKKRKSNKIDGILAAVIIFAVLILGYSIKTMFFPSEENQVISQSATQMPTMSRMALTPYDKELGKKLMDKDNDGKCDSCGMPVEMCMDSGQLQCNMDSKSTIGVLDSQHIHADWKVYINGKFLDFSDKAHMERGKSGLSVSSFIHVDSGAPSPERTGDILHMHATGVPLWVFFESLGMKFDKDCLVLETGDKYCNDGVDTLKFYVNGQINNQYENYVFNDQDKILISYGNKNQEKIQKQINTITDFSEIH